jgi:integrase
MGNGKQGKQTGLIGIDWVTEKEVFLANIGNPNTNTTYNTVLGRLEKWAKLYGFDLLELQPSEADSFISDLENGGVFVKDLKNGDFIDAFKGGRVAASVCLDISVLNSFYGWLHHRYTVIVNPFLNCARPPKKTGKKTELINSLPNEQEVEYLIESLPAYEAAAVAVMAFCGLRIGTLPSFTVNGDLFTYRSKGKEVTGKLSAVALKAIEKAKLLECKPFTGELSNTLGKSIERAVRKFCIEEGWHYHSCRDFRHYFAITEFKKDKDIHRVSKLLGHATLQVTKSYLQRLGVIDGLNHTDITETEKALREHEEEVSWMVSEMLKEDEYGLF